METTVTSRGQTVIPADIRKRHRIEVGDRLVWIDDGRTIRVCPVPAEPREIVRALRGSGRGHALAAALLVSRREDKELERLDS